MGSELNVGGLVTTGNVGIGGDVASTPLTVDGGSASVASIQLNGGNSLNDNSSIQSKYSLALKCNSTAAIASRSISFMNGATEHMKIDSAGLATFSNGISVTSGAANFAGSYLNVGGGYGSTGLSISDAGVLQADGLATFGAGIASTRITKDGAFDIASTDDDYDFNTGTGSRFKFHSGITGSRNIIGFSNPNGQVGSIETDGSATAFNTSSDYRLKENVTELTGALDRLDSIPVYAFNFKADPTKTVDGFLAHEVAAHVPEAISGTKDEMQTVVTVEAAEAVEAVAATYYAEGDELPEGVAVGDEKTPAVVAVDAVVEVTEEQPKYQGIDQSKLVPLMLAAIKELKAKVTALENA